MSGLIGWIMLMAIVGIILFVLLLLRPLLRRMNKGKYIIHRGNLIMRKDLNFYEEVGERIDENDIIELSEETASQLSPADKDWYEENKNTLKMRGYI